MSNMIRKEITIEEIADWSASVLFRDNPLLSLKICDLKAWSKTCYNDMHVDGFWSFPPLVQKV